MTDRLLPLRALLLGSCVALALFIPLHLMLGAGPLRAALAAIVGLTLTGSLLWYVRRAEVLRTTQAQGYFTAALMIVAIALVLLPPGYLVKNLLS